MITAPLWPAAMPLSDTWTLHVDGIAVPVVTSERGPFALWTCDGPCRIELTHRGPEVSAQISPRRLALKPQTAPGKIACELPGPCRLLLDAPGLPALHLFAEPPAAAAPAGARVIPAGTLVTQDVLTLSAGECLWLERGAVLNAHVRAHGAGIRIGGGGLISGTGLRPMKHVVADGCPGLRIEDLTVIDPGGWSVVLGACDDAVVQDLRALSPGDGSGTDGLDLVGCSRVHVRRAYIICGDDALVVKAFTPHEGSRVDWARSVSDITCEDCIVGTFGGHGMEIGHELTVGHVEDVTFRNIDVLFAHRFGAPFGIHNGDRAVVRRVRWTQVRIEHCYHQILDLRVMRSRFSRDRERGHISDLVFHDIDWWTTPYNAGYTVGAIGGFDAQHRVSGVRFERFRRDGVTATSADDLDVLFRHADDVVFGPA